jgi:transcriptional regulator with XRE-family HTH domain
MHYTQRLKNLREDADQKQESIALELNITRQQYQLYESGKRKLPIDLLMKLCKYYNVSADYILGFTNDPSTHWTIKNNVTINGGKNKLNFK